MIFRYLINEVFTGPFTFSSLLHCRRGKNVKGSSHVVLKYFLARPGIMRFSELSVILCTERLQVWFSVGEHTWVVGSVPSEQVQKATPWCFSLTSVSLFLSPFLSKHVLGWGLNLKIHIHLVDFELTESSVYVFYLCTGLPLKYCRVCACFSGTYTKIMQRQRYRFLSVGKACRHRERSCTASGKTIARVLHCSLVQLPLQRIPPSRVSVTSGSYQWHFI